MCENKKLIGGDDLYFKACLLDLAVNGVLRIGKDAAIPDDLSTSLSNFSNSFLRDIELAVYGEPFWSDPEACKNTPDDVKGSNQANAERTTNHEPH